MKVKITSQKQFLNVVNNCYAPKLIGVEGSPTKHKIQEPADIERVTFPVYSVSTALNAQFDTKHYESTIATQPGVLFIEDPYITEGKYVNDPNKKLNIYFKNFKDGDIVPLEYYVWRFCHNKYDQINRGLFSLYVTRENYPVIQWLLQALYNDAQNDACKLSMGTVSGLYQNLKGETDLVRLPDEVITAVVGEYNILLSNKDFIKGSIDKLQKEIESKKAMLDQAKNMQAQAQSAKGSTSTLTKKTIEQVADAIEVKNTPEQANDLLDSALEANVVTKSGSWLNINGKKIGQGKANSVQRLIQDPDLYDEIVQTFSAVGK